MPDTSIKDFEAAIAELESVVKKLEEGDLPLEQSLALYERGVLLERMGQPELATTAYRRLLERFPPEAASEPPALTDARRRLTHLERRGR